jgi:hypothetical protein
MYCILTNGCYSTNNSVQKATIKAALIKNYAWSCLIILDRHLDSSLETPFVSRAGLVSDPDDAELKAGRVRRKAEIDSTCGIREKIRFL